MVVKPFSQKIDPSVVFDIQNVQHAERLLMSETVAANSTRLCKTNVSNYGHFFCQFITGTFSTLDAGPADNLLNHLSGQLIDGAGQRKLFSDRIPFPLWLSPGRRKDVLVAGAAVGNNLFYPIEFEYLFTANSDILLDVSNNSAYANSFEICFHGIRIVSDMAVANRVRSGGGLMTNRIQPNRRG